MAKQMTTWEEMQETGLVRDNEALQDLTIEQIFEIFEVNVPSRWHHRITVTDDIISVLEI